jgi:hypothetical protein
MPEQKLRAPDLNACAGLAFAVQDFIGRMWREAEKSAGARADLFYTEDGVFIIEGMVRAEGRGNVRKISDFREGLGERLSRHLMTNYVFDFDDYAANRRVTALAVMLHFGGTGAPPLPIGLPLAVYDVTAKLRQQADDSWLIELWHMRPNFLSEAHPSLNRPLDYSASREGA